MEALDRSSSNDLSSAPSSDIEGPFSTRPPSAHSNTIVVSRDGLGPSSSSAGVNHKSGAAQSSATRQESAPVKVRKPRKKKEVDPNAPPASEKEKRPRKVRTTAGTTGNARKKLKTEDGSASSIAPQHPAQTTDLASSKLVQPASFVSDPKPPLHEAAKTTQNGFSNHNPATNSQPLSPSMSRYQTAPQPQVTAPRSRNIFDPVRGIERASEQPQTVSYPNLNGTPPRPTVFRPSASPAISSIINHPDVQEPAPSSFQPSWSSTRPEETVSTNGTKSAPINLDDVPNSEILSKVSPSAEKAATETESKPKRAKEPPPPMPSGAGLLNSSFFGGDSLSDNPEKAGKGVSIVLNLQLQKGESKIFNFARMAEEKYGFAAVYPRQAAQKERLAKVAAAGAALERSASNSKRGETSLGESGDEDLSVDIDRDSDNDGDVNMTGVNGINENSGTDGPARKQRRKRRDEYDADDPFVDDSEMLWEAQAAATKNGFFVYMGPLVAETDKTPADKGEGASKRGGRGRGRGGGPGSRGGRGGAVSAAGTEGSGRGGGAGSRGSGITRKPRITKAERQQRELEKKQREEAGSALAVKTPAAAT
ncbi:HIR complex subunit [Exophiala xenobiotica]|uniref:HIR complex subunit n=1 Tax=Lithohypha guttulata TaxID=1690604 RepID=A0ABR0K036_9EURO|nr:HIR complex subunit [Lithohypha guttulata]KAK5311542.1 HIR complex subunit [Exophiala xenobiotica]